MHRLTVDRVEAYVDPDEVTALARRLVAIPSFGTEHGWEGGVARALDDLLTGEGFAVMRQPVSADRSNLLAALPGERDGPPLLLFNGHMDTVPPSSSMVRPPFAAEVSSGRLWGRGAADMKGGLAAMAAALVALRRAGVRPPRPIVLAAVAAEETGNLGTAALAREAVRTGACASCAVVGEPTALEIVTAHKGVDRYRITVRGRAAHGATPERGVNAIVQAARLIVALEDHLGNSQRHRTHPLLGSPSYNIGTIQGGVSRNVVPDRCTFQIEKRWLPGDSPEQIRADLEAVVAQTLGPGAAEVVHEPEFEHIPHPPLAIPENHALVRALAAAAARVTGRPAACTVLAAFTDAAILQAAGIPSVVFGPGSLAVAHADDEHVPTTELHVAARVYAGLALRLCEAEWQGTPVR
ncbi:MAG: M20 family metallopeptidase [Armatimonadota bacterium]|nr:M20 family metallopeptidase [Armatimonadota bacterium]